VISVSGSWLCSVGAASVKAKVVKDGHVFVVHILDPQLEMAEETLAPETETAWLSSEETFSMQNSGADGSRAVVGCCFHAIEVVKEAESVHELTM